MGKKIIVQSNDDRLTPEIYSGSLKDDISNTKRVQRIVLMPFGHPIILLKSN